MKRVLILLMASLLIVPIDAGAQSFLKGLKEKAEKKIEKATNSILGKEGSDDEVTRLPLAATLQPYQKCNIFVNLIKSETQPRHTG